MKIKVLSINMVSFGLGVACSLALVITLLLLKIQPKPSSTGLDSKSNITRQPKGIDTVNSKISFISKAGVRKGIASHPIQTQIQDRREKVANIFTSLANIRIELDEACDPKSVFAKYSTIIEDTIAEERLLLIGQLLGSSLNFPTKDESFDWLVKYQASISETLADTYSENGQSIADEFFEKIYQKYSLTNATDELYSKIQCIPSPKVRIQFENKLLPFIISQGRDYQFLDSIVDPVRNAEIAEGTIATLNRGYNRDEAIRYYTNPHFSKIQDPEGLILKSIATPAWYATNFDNLDSFIGSLEITPSRNRFLAQLAAYSRERNDGKADDLISGISGSGGDPNSGR